MKFTMYLGEDEMAVLVEYAYEAGRPAKLSGPMEDAEEGEEGSVDISSVTLVGVKPSYELVGMLSEYSIGKISEAALEHGAGQYASKSEQRADYDRDQQIEGNSDAS